MARRLYEVFQPSAVIGFGGYPALPALLAAFKDGIPTAIHYPAPLNEQPAYGAFSRTGPLPNAEQLSRRVLSLPMHAYLTEEIQDRIADVLIEAISAA